MDANAFMKEEKQSQVKPKLVGIHIFLCLFEISPPSMIQILFAVIVVFPVVKNICFRYCNDSVSFIAIIF